MRKRSLLLFMMLACVALFSSSIAAQEPGSKPADDECKAPVYKGSEVSHRAAYMFRPLPNLTEEAKSRGIGGVVVLAAVLCRFGHVTDIKVVEGLPFGLTEQAVEAARQTKFTPAEKDGQQVSQAITFEFRFSYIGERRPLAIGPFEGRTIEAIEVGGLPPELMNGISERLETCSGEPYNKAHLEHDWQLLLNLGDFDEKASGLRIEEGERGGIGVVFELVQRTKQ